MYARNVFQLIIHFPWYVTRH